ncbi:hypothetical protein E4T41_05542 [Aureobasidium subglaciale]|nr:hypothetical protein E4T41_05542 [Aureobasidium subglaciale]
MANENTHAPPPRTSGNLTSNPMSMVEDHYSEDDWMRAVYANETIVGFLIMALWPPTDGYYIWRLMIDQKYQGQGFEKQVVELAIQHVKSTYPRAVRVGVMSTPDEGAADKKVLAGDSPYHFYTQTDRRA